MSSEQSKKKASATRPELHLIALCGVAYQFFVFVLRAPFSVDDMEKAKLTRTNLLCFLS
jgi:hypothetical protein